MDTILTESLLKNRYPNAAWPFFLIALVLLLLAQVSTDAEFAIFAFIIVPVLWMAWSNGLAQGLAAAAIASFTFLVYDIESGRQFSAAWVPYLNGLTRLVILTLTVALVSKISDLLAREVELATHDALTGILNRRGFFDNGEAESHRAKRYGHSQAVIFIDLDNFKKLNDTRGHEAGDGALKAAATALKKCMRVSDQVARLGGDEFAVLLPETLQEDAKTAAQKIAAELAKALTDFSPVSASIGVAWFAKGQSDFASMIQAADALMYEVKKAGKSGLEMRAYGEYVA